MLKKFSKHYLKFNGRNEYCPKRSTPFSLNVNINIINNIENYVFDSEFPNKQDCIVKFKILSTKTQTSMWNQIYKIKI